MSVGDALAWAVIVAAFVLFAGTPDLHDKLLLWVDAQTAAACVMP